MKLRTLVTITVLTAALPAMAAPTCTPYAVQGNNCVYNTTLGWGAAGSGWSSILTIYVQPNLSGPIDYEITALSSSLGSNYTGYFGIVARNLTQSQGVQVTFPDIKAGSQGAIGPIAPGQTLEVEVTKVCWDPTCTSAAPAGAVPNMFSLQLSMASPNTSDLDLAANPRGTLQFHNGSQVTWEETVPAQAANSRYSIIPGISLGPTPDTRYVYNGGAVTTPFDAFSVSNLNNPNALGGTITLKDLQGNVVASAPLPSIPPGGAAGFLAIGRTPDDTLGLFPSSTVLPAGPDGLFHGTLELATTGQVATGFCIIAAQQYDGFAMINLPVFHTPVP